MQAPQRLPVHDEGRTRALMRALQRLHVRAVSALPSRALEALRWLRHRRPGLRARCRGLDTLRRATRGCRAPSTRLAPRPLQGPRSRATGTGTPGHAAQV
jgi:hypothetical protein